MYKKQKINFSSILKIVFITVVVLSITSFIYSSIKGYDFLKNTYMLFYYYGAVSLILAVPQLYKKDEDVKLRRIRRQSPLYGFYDINENPYTQEAMEDSFKQFRGDGFLLGISIVIYSFLILFLGFILEKIYLLRR